MDDRELELLSAYLDGALNESERQALEARLAQDTLLQRELDQLRETKRLVGSLPSLKAPRDLTIAQSARQMHRQPLVLSPWVSSLSAVAAAFMLIAGFTLLNRAPTPQAGQEALSQPAISLAATPEAAQLRTAPSAVNAPPSQTATVLLNEESSSTERAQAQEPEVSADEDMADDEQAGAVPAPTVLPAPSAELPYDALAPAAPLSSEGSGEADQGQDRGVTQSAAPSPTPGAAAALGAMAETAVSAPPPVAEQQSDAFIPPTPTVLATLPPTISASATPSPTLTPTAAPTVAPTLAPIATSGTGGDAGSIALLIAGALLLLVAVITTVLRRRRNA